MSCPRDFALARDVCSYGYFLLEPNHWEPDAQTLTRTLQLADGAASCVITEASSGRLRAKFDRSLTRPEQAEARGLIGRMLRLDHTEADSRAFHRVDRRWKKSGRARLFRSPTLFEDIIKTVTSCNVAWPSTINMNRRLCEVLGQKSVSGGFTFPTAAKLARTRPGTLRGRCRVGYRDQRMVDLAKLMVKGEIDEAWLTDPSTTDEEAFKFLLTLPGIGPYAGANVMQLLGRFSYLAIDTETIRHCKHYHGWTGTDAALTKLARKHYEPFGKHQFQSYWFELWSDYEDRQGSAETWTKRDTATAFTASKLK